MTTSDAMAEDGMVKWKVTSTTACMASGSRGLRCSTTTVELDAQGMLGRGGHSLMQVY